MNRWKLEIFIVAVFSLARACFGRANEPCFAFLLKGDVTTVCNGKTSQITHLGNVEDFAVSDELSSFAYVTSRLTSANATVAEAAYTTTVLKLKTGESKQIQDAGTGVLSTCGGILPIDVGDGKLTSTDLATGKDVKFAPYVFFRCSSDRRIIAGISRDENTKGRLSDLYTGVPPSARIASIGDVDPHFFNVSSDGSKIAWFNDVQPLCVFSGSLPAHCVGHSGISDPVSVNDSGELLVSTGTGQGCVYKTSYNFSPVPDGAPADDECLGIGYWNAGLKSIVIIESIGRNPQWLSTKAANLLGVWSRNARNR